MLIRWATQEDCVQYGYSSSIYQRFEVLVAIHRMTEECLGFLRFSRFENSIIDIKIFDKNRKEEIKQKLEKCAKNQLEPKGNSFHYNFPKYIKRTLIKNCPSCQQPHLAPPHMDNILELKSSWVVAEKKPQGRLWGKCIVSAKFHSLYFYDLPKEEMVEYMSEIQSVAEALHIISGAIKINFEIHMNTGPHLHCHLFPRYLDDDFPSAPIDYRINNPSVYEDFNEYEWFLEQMRILIPQIHEEKQKK